jgi:hypothetical protein
VSRIRQYVYFAVRSEAVNADEVSRRLGLEPDRVMVRGSRTAEPPRPTANAWQIVCDEPGMTIDEQVKVVLQRLRPAEPRLVELAKDPDCSVVLQLVRYLDDEEGEPERLSHSDAGLQKLGGQHQLLGWHLSSDDLGFLSRIGASIDADEYG